MASADRAYPPGGENSPTPVPYNDYHQNSWLDFVGNLTLGIITSPYRRTFKLYTWKPLKDIGAADGDRRALVSLVRNWKASKYEELQSVQVAVSFQGRPLPAPKLINHRAPSVQVQHSPSSPGTQFPIQYG